MMPENAGYPPPLERVDVRYRNGRIERSVDPAKRRWTLDDPKYPPAYAYDIVHWQRTG
jgi:hypothetical protein